MIWIGEAVLIVGAAVAGVVFTIPALFCEECLRWGRTREGVLVPGGLEPEEVRKRIGAGDLSFLAARPPPAPEDLVVTRRESEWIEGLAATSIPLAALMPES